jgi:hypothetical protein
VFELELLGIGSFDDLSHVVIDIHPCDSPVSFGVEEDGRFLA